MTEALVFLDTNVFLTVDFADAIAVAHMERRGIARIISFDADLDRFPSIARQEP